MNEWGLVPENDLLRTGPEWFLILLENTETEGRAHLLFCFWKACICGMMQYMAVVKHQCLDQSVSGSVRFADIYYWRSLLSIRHGSEDARQISNG